MITARIETDKLQRRLENFSKIVKRPLDDILRQGARLAAVSLVKATFPRGSSGGNSSGVDKASQKQGQDSVARSILRIYGTTVGLASEMKQKAPRLRGAFISAIMANDYSRAQDILKRALGIYANIGKFDGGKAHRALRRFGRAPSGKSKAYYVVDHPALFDYIKTVQKRVGFAKGGWYTSAIGINAKDAQGQSIGGQLSRLPSWIRIQSAPGAHRERGTGKGMTITLNNSVKYIDKILADKYYVQAVDLAQVRMYKMMGAAIRSEMKKQFPGS